MDKKLFCSMLVLVLTVAGVAAADVTTHPGYADLESVELSLGQPAQEMNLGPDQLLEMLGESVTPEMTHLVEGIELVQARVFEVGEAQAEAVRGSLSAAAEDLRAAGWNTLVSVTNHDDFVHLLMRMQGENAVGLVALIGDDGNAVLANVVGDLDPARLMPLMGNPDAAHGFFNHLGAAVTGEH